MQFTELIAVDVKNLTVGDKFPFGFVRSRRLWG